MITKTHLKYKNIVLAIGLALSASAQADLARVGPVNPTTSFPSYYQDNNGLALDLCIPNAAELVAGTCLITPDLIPNPNAPIVFPNNFPLESFYMRAVATTPVQGLTGTTRDAVLVIGLEATFANNVAVRVNDQIVFARIRYKFVAPATGTYTVVTPYSTDTFDATVGELVFNTADVGINCPPGDFSCALQGKIGPFLRASGTAGGTALPFYNFPGGGTYLADPLLATPVTGGTLGNTFKITAPDGTVIAETDQFFLTGRVHTAPLPRATVLDRISYARSATSGQVDAFVTSLGGIGAATPTFQLTGKDISGANLTQDPSAASKFHGQAAPFNPAVLPVTASVIDTSTAPATIMTGDLTDLVTVAKAEYDAAAGTLTVQATSSDQLVPPTLTVNGSNGRVYGPLVAGAATFTGVTFPPDHVIVVSSAGGKANLPVSTTATATVGTVVAVNDLPLSTDLGAINVLANDTGVTPGAVVRIVQQPTHGTATVGAGNVVAYSATGTYNGPDNFTYYIDNGATGISNVASVDFSVITVNRPPVANADTSSVPRGGSVTIDVLANDTDPDNNPLTITAVSTPNAGTATISGNKIVFTAPSTTATGPVNFTYTVSDGTVTAIGNVTVNVLTAETISISRAQYSIRARTWQISGAILPLPNPVPTAGLSLKLYAGPAPAAGVAEDPTRLIASINTIPGDLAGRFRFGPAVSNVVPVGNQFHVVSSRGAVATFAHTINN